MKKFIIILCMLICTITVFAQNKTRYFVTIEIKQSTFALSISEHIKNNINTVEFTFETTKECYDQMKVGTELSKNFKLGSLWFDGDISHLRIKVKNKFYRYEKDKNYNPYAMHINNREHMLGYKIA